ncbi:MULTISPECIES: dUTP diphosphatase [Bacillus cereus group]|uniref:dUTPase n=8 Tax=root TaxID=1 RepID=A0A0S2MV97_9CAUD|nr:MULTISPECIES: dUTP diphosphatase [Bacillus cereus group]YP_009218178.1 nucleoside triphosphate pyrophosphohydrolase [Bacillus phage phi4J1]ALO79850.1 dUTPase [Bacillus phage phi4J1]ETE99348.1 dUTPase [Bacillus thuringiensis serovar aizawai str. Hu4-2]MCC3876084.1 dUTP diphosphatase [Bacillus thuringiensis]MCC3913496.1 dUTP diphosphatase [Bacillus thuringiensis]MCC3926786.1 dUTP diphosphatase [Bacillus thuringiensis]
MRHTTNLHIITKEETSQTFDISELMEMQKELDRRIGYKGNDKLDMLFRALLVEIGEAWNETRAFKMWSVGFGTPKEGLLVELVEGFHFLMNIVIELDRHTLKRRIAAMFREQYIMKKNILSINMLFEWYMQDILTAKRAWCQYRDLNVTLTHLHKAFGIFFRLCYLYGYKFEDIVQAYKDKNKENFERQASGY